MNENVKLDNSVCLENRKALSVTGVVDVDTFNEEEIHAKTDYGNMLIKGNSLHIETLDLDCGSLRVSGEVMAIVYSERVQPKSLFKRAFS